MAAAEKPLQAGVLSTLAILICWVQIIIAVGAAAANPAIGVADRAGAEFIRRSCSSTLYPSLCYTSLARYAIAINQDSVRLAVVAANVSLVRVRSVSFHVSSLYHAAVARRAVDAPTASAMEDCKESLGDAADLTQLATRELGLLATAEGTDVAWRVSNAQTWLSAVLTNEETCTDGFSAGLPAVPPPSPEMKADVCGRVRRAKQYTSNALALVNSLVGTKR